MSRSRSLFGQIDPAPILARLQQREINYTHDEVNTDEWHFDTWVTSLSPELPGPPEPGGVWETARDLIAAYEFSDPSLVQAVYDAATPLLGRTMLLQARFSLLRYYLGVRVTEVIDDERVDSDTGARQRAWGWAYETLQGHLERGYISYEVVKDVGSGQVSFVLNAYSQRSPKLGALTTLGWLIFGRRTQVKFYRRAGERLARAVHARRQGQTASPKVENGLTLAPTDARPRQYDRFALSLPDPG